MYSNKQKGELLYKKQNLFFKGCNLHFNDDTSTELSVNNKSVFHMLIWSSHRVVRLLFL